jgi:hypothetical protein
MFMQSSQSTGTRLRSGAIESSALSRTFKRKSSAASRLLLLGALLASSMVFCSAQSPQDKGQPAAGPGKPAVTGSPYRNQPSHITNRARAYYGLVWGVEGLSVKVVESGEMIRFSYHVLDPEKARPLNDKKVEPVLISPDKRVKLVIPSLEKVGQLRQSATPEAGKSYWMAFSNKGGVVKRGDRVNIVIGNFHADGLEVE